MANSILLYIPHIKVSILLLVVDTATRRTHFDGGTGPKEKYFEGLAYIGPEQSKYTPAEHKNSFGDRSSTRDLFLCPFSFPSCSWSLSKADFVRCARSMELIFQKGTAFSLSARTLSVVGLGKLNLKLFLPAAVMKWNSLFLSYPHTETDTHAQSALVWRFGKSHYE
jgi:hypothetical protein